MDEPMRGQLAYKPTKKREKTFAFDKKLIEAAKKREVIYNPANKSNRYVEFKEKAWTQIALELGVPVKKCKRRWASLRDRYRRITKMQEEAIENGSQLYSRWRYYDLLRFLSVNPLPNENNSEEDFTMLPEFETETMFTIDQLQKTECASTKIERIEESDPIDEFIVPNHKENFSRNTCEENNATSMFFISLARRIKAANLPTLTQMRLEADILNFTISQIEEAQNKEFF